MKTKKNVLRVMNADDSSIKYLNPWVMHASSPFALQTKTKIFMNLNQTTEPDINTTIMNHRYTSVSKQMVKTLSLMDILFSIQCEKKNTLWNNLLFGQNYRINLYAFRFGLFIGDSSMSVTFVGQMERL